MLRPLAATKAAEALALTENDLALEAAEALERAVDAHGATRIADWGTAPRAARWPATRRRRTSRRPRPRWASPCTRTRGRPRSTRSAPRRADAVVTRGERRDVEPKLTLTDGHKPRILLSGSSVLPL